MHSIRLREPWQPILQGDHVDDSPAVIGYAILVFERKFNCPTGLQSNQRILVRIEPAHESIVGVGQVCLNGHPLPATVPATVTQRGNHSFDATRHVVPHNRLTVQLHIPPESASSVVERRFSELAEVQIEILD